MWLKRRLFGDLSAVRRRNVAKSLSPFFSPVSPLRLSLPGKLAEASRAFFFLPCTAQHMFAQSHLAAAEIACLIKIPPSPRSLHASVGLN